MSNSNKSKRTKRNSPYQSRSNDLNMASPATPYDINQELRKLYSHGLSQNAKEVKESSEPGGDNKNKLQVKEPLTPKGINLTSADTATPHGRAKKNTAFSITRPSKTWNDIILDKKYMLDGDKWKVISCINEKLYAQFPTHSVLIYGPGGCGKTLLIETIASDLCCPLLTYRADDMSFSTSLDDERKKLNALFAEALSLSPCVVCIDHVENLAKKGADADKLHSWFLDMLRDFLESLTKNEDTDSRIIVMLTADSEQPVAELKRSIRLQHVIKMRIPDLRMRLEILKLSFAKIYSHPDVDLEYVARITPGFTGQMLCDVAYQSWFFSKRCSTDDNEDLPKFFEDMKKYMSLENNLVLMGDVEKAVEDLKPLALDKDRVPKITLDDVGGLFEVKKQLNRLFLKRIQQKNSRFVRKPSGILLYGPPGCGKTLIAKALAHTAGLNFIYVKGPELFDKYVGESERKVRELFSKASMLEPALIYFDEVNSLCGRRSEGGDAGAASRIVDALLVEMDGMEKRKEVYLVGATNLMEAIDPAFLRPGRFEKRIYVGIPTLEERMDILEKESNVPRIEVPFKDIASNEKCEGFSGADLSHLLTEAASAAYDRHEQLDILEMEELVITQADLEHAFSIVKPSVSEKKHVGSLVEVSS